MPRAIPLHRLREQRAQSLAQAAAADMAVQQARAALAACVPIVPPVPVKLQELEAQIRVQRYRRDIAHERIARLTARIEARSDQLAHIEAWLRDLDPLPRTR